jgi:DNA-binding winged helix-turn-helix (wHTH) protein
LGNGTYSTYLMVHRLCVMLRERGCDPAPVLQAHGLPADADVESDRIFPLEDLLAVHDAISRMLDEPTLGLTLARRFQARDYGVFGYVSRHSESYHASIVRLREYILSLWHGYTFAITERDGLITLRVGFNHAVVGAHLWHQELLASLYLRSAEVAERPFRPAAVRFKQAAVRPEDFVALFGVLPEFGAEHDELVVRSDDARIPLTTADPALLQHLHIAVAAQIEQRRLAEGLADDVLRLNGCTIDLRRGVVRRGNETLSLTTKEKAVLEYFAARANEVVTREDLERDIWGIGKTVISHAPAVAIRRLRQKIEPNEGRPINLITVFGEGWKLQLAPEA